MLEICCSRVQGQTNFVTKTIQELLVTSMGGSQKTS